MLEVLSLLLADDLKLWNIVDVSGGSETNQRALDELWNWSTLWLLSINQAKCSVLRIGSKLFTPTLHSSNNWKKAASRGFRMLWLIRRSFGMKMKQIARLGKRTEGRSRRMRVTFVEETSPKLIVSRLIRLKGLKIHVRADLDPADREKLKSAMLGLKRRTDDAETNHRIVNFRVGTRIPPRIQISRFLMLHACPAVPTAAC
ncbi:unnamed protein product, partial [Dicrocoelium dendriticum]